MMKCRIHPYEIGAGVCASCLRERLLELIASEGGRSPEHRLNLGPTPLAASPYLARRLSVGSGPSPSRLRRFFSTPQVGPAINSKSYIDEIGVAAARAGSRHRRKFSLFSALFGYSRSDEMKPSSSSSRSSSWIYGLIFHGRQKKSSKFRPQSFQDRGMSPARGGHGGDSACSSGYSTESPTDLRRRPEPTPVRKFNSVSRSSRGAAAGFAVCLSPLVRPGTKSAADVGISGEPRAKCARRRAHASNGSASFEPSRSRKLADYGRFR